MPAPVVGNLYADAAPPVQGERFDVLLSHQGLVIERIVSTSKIASQQYIQQQDEWVVLLKGSATLDVAGQSVSLSDGDHLFLPAHTPHTVLAVTDGAMWLAVHLHPRDSLPE